MRIGIITIGLALIAVGIVGFGHIIKIGGANPGISWCLGLGPFAIGFSVLLILSLGKEEK